MSTYYKSQTVSSLSHMLGNVVGKVVNLYKKELPPNLFKTIHITTRSAMKNTQLASKKEILAKGKPILMLRPKANIEYDAEYMNGFFNQMPMYDMVDRSMLTHIFQDYDKHIYLDMSMRRMRFTVDTSIIVETDVQQQNIAYTMLNKFVPEAPYYMEGTFVDVELPKNYIIQIANEAGYYDAINKKVTNLEAFMKYLNQNSKLPISYRLKGSSGNFEFFAIYQCDAIIAYDGYPSMDDGSQIGQTYSNFTVTQTLYMDITIPSFIHYFSAEPPALILPEDATSIMNSEIIPMFDLDQSPIPKIDINGWKLCVESMYGFSEDCTDEHIPYVALLSERHINTAKYSAARGITRPFLNVVMYENEVPMTTVSYTMDYNKPEEFAIDIPAMLTINRYHFAIYEDSEYINTIIEEIKESNV